MIRNNKIYQTNNYDKFNNFLGNRSVASVKSRHHIEKLMESMRKSYLPQPIIVDENMAVLDGQHRLEAARQLNLPIYYLKMHSPISVMDIQRVNNVTNKWDTNDYLSSNLELEKDKYPTNFHQHPYHLYSWFKKRYKFAHRNILEMFYNNYDEKVMNEAFRSGNLIVKNLEKAKSQAEYIHSFKHLMIQVPYNNRAFVSAFLKVMKHHNFNRKTWIQKVQMNSRRLVKCTTMGDYRAVICDVYNWNNRINKIKLDD